MKIQDLNRRWNEAMDGISIGVVVIGRNEGERLRACLASLNGIDARVYVDSGSSDGSNVLARSFGFDVVDLDLAKPFTAARARNTGIAWLLRHYPRLTMVQTVDGDCEVHADWLDVAKADMVADPRRAVVFGRRRERYPHANAYHMACDDEWNVPIGEVNSCGGDALLRVVALREVGGYNDLLIAGEEPEMCLRLRQQDWHIWSNGREMTLHDVAITRLGQWWHRSRRTGFAFAELVDLHGDCADPFWQRLLRSGLAWTTVNLAAIVGLSLFLLIDDHVLQLIALIPLVLSTTQLLRMAKSKRNRFGIYYAGHWSALMMIAKAAQTLGWLRFKLQRVTQSRTTLIEYKS